MIRAIPSSSIDQHRDLVNQMFRVRAKVFKDRHNWSVDVKDGLEIDRFDECNPVYVLSVNESEQFEGSLRLLPTTGHNMLRDVFQELLEEGEVIESATIWESSRFCINPDLPAEYGPSRLNKVTTDILYGACEIGARIGLTHIVTVYDARMARIFRSAKCPIDVIGGPKRIGPVITYAGVIEMGEATNRMIGQACGISGTLLDPHYVDIPAAA